MENEVKEKVNGYNFIINNPEKFDFYRIIKEVKQDYPGCNGFIITFENECIVIVYPSFYKRFKKMDNVILNCVYLSKEWGNSTEDFNIIINDNNRRFEKVWKESILTEKNKCSVYDVRFSFFRAEYLERIKNELAIAKEFKRKLKIDVEVF